ncbi:MAG: hypothetical protein NVS9B1_21770 [Candidatus Dormibacteraceae bacterium]
MTSTSKRGSLLSLWWAWGPALGVGLSLWPRIPIATLHEDEGVVTMAALQLLVGHVVYRDFVAGISPLIPLLYAAAFGLLGSSLLVDRLVTALPMVAGTVLTAVIARRLLPAGWAAAAALLWGIWLPVFIGYGAYHFWGPAFILAMAAALAPARPRLYLAGALAALALLCYQALAPAVLAGLLVAFLARRQLGDLGRMAAPSVLAGMALAGYLLAQGTLGAFIDQTIVNPSGRYQSFNRLPFPWNPLLLGDTLNVHSSLAAFWEFPMFWLLGVAVPIAVAGFAAVAIVGSLRRGAAPSPVLALAILSTGLFASAFVARVGGPICWLAAPIALILAAHRLRGLTDVPQRWRRAAALAPVVALFIAGLSPAPVGWWLSCTADPGGPMARVDTVAGPVCLSHREAAQLEVALRAAAAAEAGIAFLPTSPGLYELTASTPEIPSFWTLPHFTRQIEIARTEAAMRMHAGNAVYIDDPELDTGHPWQFDEFLAQNYRVVEAGPGITVYERR